MGRSTETDPALTDTARRWLVRLTSGEMTEREMVQFREWVEEPGHERIFQRELTNWRKLGQLREGLAGSIRLPSAAQVLRRRLTHWGKIGATAAVAVSSIVIFGPSLLVRAQADHLAGAELRRVTLPDGSHAVLDAGAALAVRFSDGKRRVELLRGRAWFDVAHGPGPRFEVSAAGGLIQDIGTAFEVSREGDDVEAAVSEGTVRVFASSRSDASQVLHAGQRVRFNDTAFAREADIPIRRVAAWRTGNIVLEGVTIRQAIAEVSRYRSGPTWVWGKISTAQPITVVLRSDRPEAALQALAVSANLSLLKAPGGITIVRQKSAQ